MQALKTLTQSLKLVFLTLCLVAVLCSFSIPAIAATIYTVYMGSFTAGGLVFDENILTIHVGDTIQWHNSILGPHNVVFNTVPEGVDADAISLTQLVITPGIAHQVTFAVPGTYSYYCSPHRGAGMVGTIVVEPS